MMQLTEEKRWITVNGQHVQIDDDGTVVSNGPLKGTKLGKGGDKPAAKDSGEKQDQPAKPAAKKPHVTETPETSLQWYKKYGSTQVNTALRINDPKYFSDHAVNHTGGESITVRDAIKGIDAAFAKATPLESDKTVYRGLSQMPRGKVTVGGTISDKGYASTSDSIDVAKRFADGGPILVVTAKKGSRVVRLPGQVAGKEEHETLLPRNAKLTVTKIDSSTGRTIIHATYDGGRAREGTVRIDAFIEAYAAQIDLEQLRTNAEAKLEKLLAKLDERHKKQLRAAIKQYGWNVPDEVWQAIQQDQENEELAAAILLLFTAADDWTTDAIKQQDVVARGYSRRQFMTYAFDAQKTVQQLAAQTTDTLRKRITRKVQDAQLTGPGDVGEITDEGIDATLDDVFTPERRKGIATDQTTGAFSKGQTAAAERITDGASTTAGQSVTIRMLWVSERDNLVCPRCAPLDRQPEEVWGLVFPNGPGPEAHPNCRCALIPQVVVSTTTEESFREEKRWITVNGNHVQIDDDGTVISDGPLKGKNLKAASGKGDKDEPGKATKSKGFTQQPATAAELHKVKPVDAKGKPVKAKQIVGYHVTTRAAADAILKDGFNLEKVKPRWRNDYAVSLTRGSVKVGAAYFTKADGIFDSDKYVVLKVTAKGAAFADPKDAPATKLATNANAKDYTKAVVRAGYDAMSGKNAAYIYNPKAISNIEEVPVAELTAAGVKLKSK